MSNITHLIVMITTIILLATLVIHTLIFQKSKIFEIFVLNVID